MFSYRQIKDKQGNFVCINRSDGASIPFDPANTDYQAYLKWLEEGNEVLPAVEPPADEPPAVEPPADEPPADEPPADEPLPADEPPADEPPADEPPADEPPADEVIE
jgi:hypothetical protein